MAEDKVFYAIYDTLLERTEITGLNVWEAFRLVRKMRLGCVVTKFTTVDRKTRCEFFTRFGTPEF